MFIPFSIVQQPQQGFVNQIAPSTGSWTSQSEKQPAPQQQKTITNFQAKSITNTIPAVNNPAQMAYTTENQKALGTQTNAGSVLEQLQNFYSPKALGLGNQNMPSNREMKSFANNLTTSANQYQTTADQFGTLYSDFVEGRLSEEETLDALRQMQQLSKSAAGQFESVNKLFDNPMFAPQQSIAGMPMQRNTLGLNPAQRFTLPKETWNMNPAQLANWIQRYEKNMGNDWIGGKLAWTVGPSLIAGAAAGALTGVPGINLTNSVIGSGIENLTGMNNR